MSKGISGTVQKTPRKAGRPNAIPLELYDGV